ncbi:ribosome assembly factor SBDS [Candidatus Woesearchaeota archaeon]|nr:ribosome assembly factor SBDS [Candidatus Woesearchaeota archaeon]
MVRVEDAVIAKLKKEGKTYEILVDCEKALDFRKGKSVSINDVVVTEEIFYDAKKGTRASEHELEKIFGTSDKLDICKAIIMEGTVPLTADLLRKELGVKRKRIIDTIHRNVVDPSTGKPHPPQRIDAAINEARVRIDENKTAEQQVQEVIDAIRRILPIKYEIRELSVRVPAQYAGRAMPIIKKYGKLLSDAWENDGGLRVNVEIPAGLQEELEVALNSIAKGSVEIRIVKTR